MMNEVFTHSLLACFSILRNSDEQNDRLIECPDFSKLIKLFIKTKFIIIASILKSTLIPQYLTQSWNTRTKLIILNCETMKGCVGGGRSERANKKLGVYEKALIRRFDHFQKPCLTIFLMEYHDSGTNSSILRVKCFFFFYKGQLCSFMSRDAGIFM